MSAQTTQARSRSLSDTLDRLITQARTAEVVGGTTLRHVFWPDLSRPTIFIQQDKPLSSLNVATNPRFLLGCSPWREGFGGQGPTSNDECPSGEFRHLKLFNAALALTDLVAEANSTTNTPVTTAGMTSKWYSNLDPTPTDVSDKSGAGHSPTWDNANRPTRWP